MHPSVICETYLNEVFKAIPYVCENLSETSGEILPPSVAKLITALNITPADVMADLGSGTGKLAAQFFLQSDAKDVFGIEIRKELHDIAQQAKLRMEQELPAFYENNRQLKFFCGSFLEYDLNGITIALVNSVCISQQTLLLLEQRLNTLTSLRYVLTTRPMATLTLPFFKTIRVECSWDTALCYLYKR